jgi:hypothetical protein
MLATRAEAEAMLERLRGLGITPGAIGESHAGGGFYEVDWGGEDRRLFDIGGMCVGLLLERYARNPREFADQMTLEEWNGMVSA